MKFSDYPVVETHQSPNFGRSAHRPTYPSHTPLKSKISHWRAKLLQWLMIWTFRAAATLIILALLLGFDSAKFKHKTDHLFGMQTTSVKGGKK